MAPMDRPLTGQTIRVTAALVVLDSGTVVPNGSVIVHGGQVVEVDAAEAHKKIAADITIRLPGHVLHPGFVNVHAHLELSYMKGRLAPKAPFADWIRRLIALRAKTKPAAAVRHAVMGANRLARTGCCTVADVTQTGCAIPALAALGLRGVIFHEVIGFNPDLAREKLSDLAQRMEEGGKLGGMLLHGAAPHAVYSTSGELIKSSAEMAHALGAPLSVHLAETAEEETFSTKGTGPLAELLKDMGSYNRLWIPKARPLKVLQKQDALAGALLAHCNHVSAEDITAMKKAGAAVAYCPGSNQWFGRTGPHPLMSIIAKGIPVGLGTDSLASNGDLDMRREMRLLMEKFGDITVAEAFYMATEGGAKALGMGKDAGTLRPGAPFDATAIKLSIGRNGGPFARIIGSKSGYVRTWVAANPVTL